MEGAAAVEVQSKPGQTNTKTALVRKPPEATLQSSRRWAARETNRDRERESERQTERERESKGDVTCETGRINGSLDITLSHTISG